MKRLLQFIRNRWERVTTVVAVTFTVVWAGSLVFAQTLQDVLTEVINYDYTQAFIDTTGVAGVAVLFTKLFRVVAANVFGRTVDGLAAYAVPIGFSVLLGVVGQLADWIPSAALSAPAPLGGLMFGIAAGLAAVGLHQAKRQTQSALATQASRLRR